MAGVTPRLGATRIGVAGLCVVVAATLVELLAVWLMALDHWPPPVLGLVLVLLVAPVAEEQLKATALRLFGGDRLDWARDWPRIGLAFGLVEGGGKLLGMAAGGTEAVATLFGGPLSVLLHAALGVLAGRLAVRHGVRTALTWAMLAHAASNGLATLPVRVPAEWLGGVPGVVLSLLLPAVFAVGLLLLARWLGAGYSAAAGSGAAPGSPNTSASSR